MRGRRLVRSAAAIPVALVLLLFGADPAQATQWTCYQGYAYLQQGSYASFGGASGILTVSSEYLQYGWDHILQDVDIVDTGIGPCPGAPGGCWTQDGFLRGTISSGSKSSGDQSTPQVYVEFNNPWGYDVGVSQGLSGSGIQTFFNDYSVGTTDGYGHYVWASYATRLSPWNPVLLAGTPLYHLTAPMDVGLEMSQRQTTNCPSPSLSTYDQLSNAPYPANNWSLWTSAFGFVPPTAASPPYYYVRYQNNWLFQTNGAY